MLPLVVIVGRTNVGKSTLFNRLIGRRLAIVDELPGVTRDRMYADAVWTFGRFGVVDTGGWDQADEEMRELVDEQRRLALAEADLVLFMVDTAAGVTPEDREIADQLRQLKKPLLIIANKTDNEKLDVMVGEFYDLGLPADVVPLAAKSRRHWRELLSLLEKLVGGYAEDDSRESGPLPLAIVGRPNSGKSSLVNALVGENRLIISAVPGTTRDAISVPFTYHGRGFLLVDTAGLRRRSKVRGEVLERLTVVRALEHIRRGRMVMMLVDATEGLVEQDTKILGYALEQGRAALLVYNKCDLIELDRAEKRRLTEEVHAELGFANRLPVAFVSAKDGLGLHLMLDEVCKLADAYERRLSTGEINRLLEDAQERHAPPLSHGKPVKLLYGTQTSTAPPRFVFFTNRPAELHFSYQRFLENRLREAGGWEGVPLFIEYRCAKPERKPRS